MRSLSLSLSVSLSLSLSLSVCLCVYVCLSACVSLSLYHSHTHVRAHALASMNHFDLICFFVATSFPFYLNLNWCVLTSLSLMFPLNFNPCKKLVHIKRQLDCIGRGFCNKARELSNFTKLHPLKNVVTLILCHASKGGSIGSMPACSPKDQSLDPAWGKLVWHNCLKRKLCCCLCHVL